MTANVLNRPGRVTFDLDFSDDECEKDGNPFTESAASLLWNKKRSTRKIKTKSTETVDNTQQLILFLTNQLCQNKTFSKNHSTADNSWANKMTVQQSTVGNLQEPNSNEDSGYKTSSAKSVTDTLSSATSVDSTWEKGYDLPLPTDRSMGIAAALEMLTSELKLLQQQDIALLKELMQIHFTMRMLKRNVCRRSSSMAAFKTKGAPSFTITPEAKPILMKRSIHPPLSRVLSEPAPYPTITSQSSLSSMEEQDEDDIEEDFLANSFNSVDSEPGHHGLLKLSLDLDDGTAELLDDMPISLRRKYLTALTSNAPVLPYIKHSLSSFNSGQFSLEKRRLSRQDAIHLSRSSSIDSTACNTDITATL